MRRGRHIARSLVLLQKFWRLKLNVFRHRKGEQRKSRIAPHTGQLFAANRYSRPPRINIGQNQASRKKVVWSAPLVAQAQKAGKKFWLTERGQMSRPGLQSNAQRLNVGQRWPPIKK